MNWQLFLSAVALMLIFEGLGPALFPRKWRAYLLQIVQSDERTLKVTGIILILVGALLFHFVQSD
ncbi:MULTISPECIES: DUF2065 domain-containing protein [unclassified Pseudoalteromonas]|uniref:DUF2065 domain-containing protein n=1 Tax=unclassified Pseudoalteromonas TaxID=194690 RepID=UPI000CF6ECD4|nr:MULTISPECIES: DUF2065 domain-containing protein [unclassified Pseudoalteromonas]MBS3797335.1 DUF2065 domain-containing protein [Pseudoalteromonas sp. BDTF-M6]